MLFLGVPVARQRVLIMAGGTGGHIFPGLAVARALSQQGYDVAWLGTAYGMEKELVPAAGFHLTTLAVRGFRGKGLRQKIVSLLRLGWSLLQALYSVWRLQPVFVLGFGGYASVPGGLAAWLLRKPLIIHEQNAVAGTSNRLLARFSRRVCEAFPGVFLSQRAKLTGNPVRAEIHALSAVTLAKFDQVRPLQILILGGSQGSQAINEICPAAMALFLPQARPKIWHQTGQQHLTTVTQAYEQAGVCARVDAFIAEMSVAYAWADLVIARAGALTVSELAAAGLPSILIPLPNAIDHHQQKNAEYLAAGAAAVILPQAELTPSHLHAQIKALGVFAQLQSMAQAARKLAMPDATDAIISQCLEAVHG